MLGFGIWTVLGLILWSAGYLGEGTSATVLAIVIGLVKPYALVFVLPSLYAWLWLPQAHAAAPAANLAIMALGVMWLSDRALGTALLPF